jgi:hypothetical protein
MLTEVFENFWSMYFLVNRIGRKKCAYGLVLINALANILIAIIVNVDIGRDAKIGIYAVIRLVNGLTSTLYSTAVVLGEIFSSKILFKINRSILTFFLKRWKSWAQSTVSLLPIQFIIFIYSESI